MIIRSRLMHTCKIEKFQNLKVKANENKIQTNKNAMSFEGNKQCKIECDRNDMLGWTAGAQAIAEIVFTLLKS